MVEHNQILPNARIFLKRNLTKEFVRRSDDEETDTAVQSNILVDNAT